jgi:hypothetical protein
MGGTEALESYGGILPVPPVQEEIMSVGDNDVTYGFTNGFANSVVNDLLDNSTGYANGPERALLSALLFDGVQSCISYFIASTEDERSQFREAYNWVMENDTDYAFSFVCVCEALGINAEYLRLGLLNASQSLLQHVSKSRRNS